jgi:hypothetical protein
MKRFGQSAWAIRPAGLAAITSWLLAGHGLAAGATWGLLLIPESNIAMLLLSLLTAIVIVILVGLVETTALLAWTDRSTRGLAGWRARLLDAGRRLPAFLAGLTAFALLWWLTARIDSWWTLHRGEIDAWLLVTFAWTDATPLHAVVGWITWSIRYVLGLSIALSLVLRGIRALNRPDWLLDALGPIRLAAIAICLLVLVMLPWQVAEWRPARLPATWVEAMFVVAKLGAIALVAHVGWALVLLTAARTQSERQSTSVQDLPA